MGCCGSKQLVMSGAPTSSESLNGDEKSGGDLNYKQQNSKEIFHENRNAQFQDEMDSRQDMEMVILLPQTLKKYKQNHPEHAEAFQRIFDEIQVLRQVFDTDLNEQVLGNINVALSYLVDMSMGTVGSAGKSSGTLYTEVRNFLVDIEAAVVFQRLATHLFEQYLQFSSVFTDYQSFDAESIDPQIGINVTFLARMLLILLNFADFHDGFCLACAKAGVISMCFKYIRRIDKENESWESASVPVGLIESTVGILHNISRRVRDRTLFANCNCEETLLRFAKVKVACIASPSLLCLAYLVDEDTNHLILADENLLECIITMLDVAYQSENRRCEGFVPEELADGLSYLAINDTNKKVLGEKGAIHILVSMLKASNDDGERASAVKALWMLAFDEGNKDKIREEEGALDTLRELQQSHSPDVQKSAAGALWELEGKQTRNAGKKKEASGNHVMISYQWDAQQVMIEVKNGLQANGYRVWMDLEQMGGSTLETMAKAVENASVVLVGVSQRYKESPNCRSEAEYAYQLRKDIIPLMVQRDYKADGWLGMIIGTKLWIDFESKHVVQAGTEKLVKELGGRGKDIDKMDGPIVPLVQRTETDALMATPSASVVSGWKSSDVKKWLTEIGLDKVCKSAIPDLNGQILIALQELREECPEYFYRSLEERMNLKDLFILLKFKIELNKLLAL